MSRRIARILTSFTFLLFLIGQVAEATVRRVKPDAPESPHDGSTWARAYLDLQDAITAASAGDEIWVAASTYKPSVRTIPSNPRSVTFSLKNAVATHGGFAIYGGFAGTESTLNERDAQANETILSGDLNGDDGSPFTNRTDNCYHVITADSSSSAPPTVVDGFTIRGGHADGAILIGAGIDIIGLTSSPRIISCVITDNSSSSAGGGLACSTKLGHPFIQNCHFLNNQTVSRGGGAWIVDAERIEFNGCVFQGNSTTATTSSALGERAGGALFWAENNPTGILASITNCTFENNSTTNGPGGAICLFGWDIPLEIRNCLFTGNSANGGGDGRGGAIFIMQRGEATIVNCDFVENAAGRSGGGVGVDSSAGLVPVFEEDPPAPPEDIVNCRFLGNTAPTDAGLGGGLFIDTISIELLVRVTNCLFAENSAYVGGGVHCSAHSSNPAIFTNVTIADNQAGGGGYFGGIGMPGASRVEVYNSILWGNTDSTSGGGVTNEQQIGPIDSPSPIIRYSCVEGGVYTGTGSTGNISIDPLFFDATNSDPLQRNYRLQPCSLAIDAADYDAVELAEDPGDLDADTDTGEPTPLDLESVNRWFDNARTDEGHGTYPFVDMGAYENHAPECVIAGDLNADSVFDGLDIAPFIECVLAESQECPCADLDLSGRTSVDDIPCFVKLLLTGEECGIACDSGQRSFPDCNTNGVPDLNDIANGTSGDCNANGVPDECDVDEGDPDGNELVSDDVNTNGIPDECEVDCNTNGVPDAWDISQTTSADVNSNGVPDECEADCNTNGVPDDWDIAQTTSADCNDDGIPDECEPDCNSNGVPDDCDVDPEDPDGDEWVSPDCNGNGWPDECDLAIPAGMGGSLDCNMNGIPDECDIAACESAPACGDCNMNGIPDACDIAAEISTDADTNGIPDECEEENLMGGGSSMMSGGGGWDEGAAWEAFYEWSAGQCWGPSCEMPMDAQFAAMVAKLQELGLPVRGTAMSP